MEEGSSAEDALWGFLATRGARSKAAVGSGPGGERGLFATADVGKGEEVAFVPSALVLDEKTAPRAVLGALDRVLSPPREEGGGGWSVAVPLWAVAAPLPKGGGCSAAKGQRARATIF